MDLDTTFRDLASSGFKAVMQDQADPMVQAEQHDDASSSFSEG
jgi:hypothetical protein